MRKANKINPPVKLVENEVKKHCITEGWLPEGKGAGGG